MNALSQFFGNPLKHFSTKNGSTKFLKIGRIHGDELNSGKIAEFSFSNEREKKNEGRAFLALGFRFFEKLLSA